MIEKLAQQFHDLVYQFSNDENLTQTLWKTIHKKYTQKSRAYHNLTHLNNMFTELKSFEKEVEDLSLLKFSIWYHDLIYNSASKQNEKKSAEQAKAVLTQLSFSTDRINRCFRQIMLTQHHQAKPNDPMDEKLIIDLDLEILSRDWEQYKTYCEQIRKEYWIYPDIIYRKGRKAALETFLERENIYQTDFYRIEKEVMARKNIRKEIDELL